MWELDYKESWALKNWCFWTVLLEKALESPSDCKKIKPVNPKGNQLWRFTRSTDAEALILRPPDAKSWHTGKDPDVGKDWRQEEKGTTEDGMVGWHHRWDGHEFEQAPEVGEGQGSQCIAVHGVPKCWIRLSNWTELTCNVLLSDTYAAWSLSSLRSLLKCNLPKEAFSNHLWLK